MSPSSSRRPTFILPAPQTGSDYWIFEHVPAGDGPWPAVAFMDGDDQFRFGVAAYEALRAEGVAPPLLLVGVGYGAGYTKPGNRRLRDYTPTALPTEPGSGGADAFLAFLAETLWPALQERHPVDRERRGLAGHSLGSLLVLHALLRPAPSFSHFLASAPSLWWDDGALLGAADRLQRTGTALPARLYLAVGEDDTPSMTGDLGRFEDQLAARPFPGLRVISRRFSKRDHYNVLPDAFRDGLGRLFA